MCMADPVNIVDQILGITPGISVACHQIADVGRSGAFFLEDFKNFLAVHNYIFLRNL